MFTSWDINKNLFILSFRENKHSYYDDYKPSYDDRRSQHYGTKSGS